MPTLLLILLSVVPRPSVRVERIDTLERNFFFDDCGKLVFCQIIFRDEQDNVIAWRMAKSEALCIHRDHGGKGWFMLWIDDGVTREVSAKSFMETFTQFDRELVERERLPVERRRGLRK